MIITRLKLTNWRNFVVADISLRDRMFIIGPNASGKSNLLDAIRFLRDVAKREGGGLQSAVARRGGVRQLRCRSARGNSIVAIEVHLGKDADQPPEWEYSLAFNVESAGRRRVLVYSEKVTRNGNTVVNRPDSDDAADAERRTETALEQINLNRPFRDVADFLDGVTYLHLVPQLVRHGAEIAGNRLENDPFGQGFLERVASANTKTRKSRLNKIQSAIASIVPQLRDIEFERDKTSGRPRLKARFENWRSHDTWQMEDQFSDGTLRLIGLFWSLLENDRLLLLEEPEISLNRDVVLRLPSLLYRLSRPVRRRRGEHRIVEQRQVILTTHSADMLCDRGIDGREVLFISPTDEGSVVKSMADDPAMRQVLRAGVMPSEIAPFRNHDIQLPLDLNLTA